MLKIVIYLGANSSTKPFCSLPLRTSMGSLDWARCYWCDYWVRNPYMYDWPWGDYGPMCEWCECLQRLDADWMQHPDWHWWCRRPNPRMRLFLELCQGGFPPSVAWDITLYSLDPVR